MENEEKDIENIDSIQEENSEISADDDISLEELANNDEFSFLDEIEETSETTEAVDDISQEENQNTDESNEIEEIKEEKSYVPTVEVDWDENNGENQELITVRPVKFQQFESAIPNRSIKKNLDIMQDISMHVSVELGRTKSSIKDVMEMEKGTIVELDKIAGEQVEIFVNEKLVAKGEVIVIEDKFGVRVTSTNIQKTIQ